MKTWYAVLMNNEDTDWGTGSFDHQEAYGMALAYGADAAIAEIGGGYDDEGNATTEPICISVTPMRELMEIMVDDWMGYQAGMDTEDMEREGEPYYDDEAKTWMQEIRDPNDTRKAYALAAYPNGNVELVCLGSY